MRFSSGPIISLQLDSETAKFSVFLPIFKAPAAEVPLENAGERVGK